MDLGFGLSRLALEFGPLASAYGVARGRWGWPLAVAVAATPLALYVGGSKGLPVLIGLVFVGLQLAVAQAVRKRATRLAWWLLAPVAPIWIRLWLVI